MAARIRIERGKERARLKAEAAKQGAAKPARDAAVGRMVAKSKQVAGNKMVAKTEREMAARNAAERGKAVGRMVAKSKGAAGAGAASAATKATPKASGRGTPERAAKAAALRGRRKEQIARADAARKQAAWDAARAKGGPPLRESKVATYDGRREMTMGVGERMLTVREAPGGKGKYQVHEGDNRAAGRGGARGLGTFDSLGAAKKFARQELTGVVPKPASAKANAAKSQRLKQGLAEEVARIRKTNRYSRERKAQEIREARNVLRGADPTHKTRLAEQRARAERRRAEKGRQGRLPFERASATKRLTGASKAAAERAGAANAARPKGPAKDDEVLGTILSVKAERSGRYAKLPDREKAAAAADVIGPREADLGFAKHGKVPIHEIRKAVAAKFGPEAAGPALDKQLFKLEAEGKIRLIAIGDRARATREQLRESIPGVRETFFLVEPVAGAGRASALKALTRKSKEASERAGAVRQAPTTAENIAAKGRAARKAQARDVARSVANRPAPSDANRAAVQAARQAMRAKSAAEKAARPAATPAGTVPHRVGTIPRRDAAADVARAAEKADAARTARAVAKPERVAIVRTTGNDVLRIGQVKEKAKDRLRKMEMRGERGTPAFYKQQSRVNQLDRAHQDAQRKHAARVRPTSPLDPREHISAGMQGQTLSRENITARIKQMRAANVAEARTKSAAVGRKAAGRGTPERAAKAVVKRVERAADATIKSLAKDHPSGLVPIPVLRDRLAAKLGPAAAGKVLDRVLLDKHGERLIAISDLRKATKEQLAKAVPGVNETLYYVKVPRSSAPKASGRGTPERAARAVALRTERATSAPRSGSRGTWPPLPRQPRHPAAGCGSPTSTPRCPAGRRRR